MKLLQGLNTKVAQWYSAYLTWMKPWVQAPAPHKTEMMAFTLPRTQKVKTGEL